MGRHLFPEPILISQLVRMEIHSLVIESLKNIIDQYPNYYEGYSELLKEMDDYEGHKALVLCLKGERNILGIYNIKRMIYEPATVSLYDRLLFYIGRPFYNIDFAFYLRVQSDFISASESPYYKVTEKIREFDNKRKILPYNILTKMSLPDFADSISQQAQSEARLRACKLGLALKVYKANKGVYPESLQDLTPKILDELPVDPFTGQNFIYRKEGDGFIVYSVGKNKKDDGGIYGRELVAGRAQDKKLYEFDDCCTWQSSK